MRTEYAYGVARTRIKESDLLTKAEIEQLLSIPGYEEAIQFLGNKGYDTSGNSYATMLAARRDALWLFLDELEIPQELLNVFRYDVDYHNLKVAIKALGTDLSTEELMLRGGTIEIDKIEEAVKRRDFSSLPPKMQEAGKTATECFLQTGDGQLCDMILDRSTLESILDAGDKSNVPLISAYAKQKVATTVIRIAARCCKMKKSEAFISRGILSCDGIDGSELALAASKGMDELCEYLQQTPYHACVIALNESMTAYEKWSDNSIIALIREEKHKTLTVGPIIAYMLALEYEIKMVQLILSGKQNQLREEVIRERMRDFYV